MTRKEKDVFGEIKNKAMKEYFKLAACYEDGQEYQVKLGLAREKCLAYNSLDDAFEKLNSNEVAD